MSLVTRSDRPEGVPPPSPLLSSEEAIALVGITYRQMDYWKRVGVVKPAKGGHGSGSPARWSLADVVRMGVIAGLQRAGMTFEAAVSLSEVRTDG